jgi:hypothetical protein
MSPSPLCLVLSLVTINIFSTGFPLAGHFLQAQCKDGLNI